jgi:hypothetical protein
VRVQIGLQLLERVVNLHPEGDPIELVQQGLLEMLADPVRLRALRLRPCVVDILHPPGTARTRAATCAVKTARPSRRDRIRAMLADLKMPGALEALDGILSGVDGGALTPAEAIERLLGVQITLAISLAIAAARYAQQVNVLTHPSLLVVDEIGYLPVSRTGAMLFFQLMSRRYEHASTVLTSNKSFEDWGEILGDEVMAAALIDRILHYCHVVNIRGSSYRMRHHTDLWHALQTSGSEDTNSPPKRQRKRKEALTV